MLQLGVIEASRRACHQLTMPTAESALVTNHTRGSLRVGKLGGGMVVLPPLAMLSLPLHCSDETCCAEWVMLTQLFGRFERGIRADVSHTLFIQSEQAASLCTID
jgi:hypothetical protein